MTGPGSRVEALICGQYAANIPGKTSRPYVLEITVSPQNDRPL